MLVKIATALTLIVALQAAALAGVEGTKAAYLGGSAAELAHVKPGVEGVFDTTNDAELRFVFRFEKAEHTFAIPYARVQSVEYSQKPGTMALFSRKHMHYLTIKYANDAGVEQVAVFELGKRIVRPTLTVLELRTGKKVQVAG